MSLILTQIFCGPKMINFLEEIVLKELFVSLQNDFKIEQIKFELISSMHIIPASYQSMDIIKGSKNVYL